jgi:hypothetical protein
MNTGLNPAGQRPPIRRRPGGRWVAATAAVAVAVTTGGVLLAVGANDPARPAAATGTPAADPTGTRAADPIGTPPGIGATGPTTTPTGRGAAASDETAERLVPASGGAASPATDDIDGDGRQDTVSVPAPGRLKVRYGNGRTGIVTFQADGGSRLLGIADADRDGRDEVFVHVGTGASTDQTAAFRYVAGRLRVVTLDGHQLQLVSGASLRHADTWACRPPAAPIVQWSAASTDGSTYAGTEVSYRFSGATLVPVSSRPLVVDDTIRPPTGCGELPTA